MTNDYPLNGRAEVPQECVAPLPTDSTHSVIIKKVENGFIINVGCKTFVSLTWKEASEALDYYWRDPEAARKHYCKS